MAATPQSMRQFLSAASRADQRQTPGARRGLARKVLGAPETMHGGAAERRRRVRDAALVVEVIAGLAVLDDIEPVFLALGVEAQADEPLDRERDDRGSSARQRDRDPHGLELLEPERLAHDRGEVRVEVRLRLGCREEAGDGGPEGAADAVDPEGIERVVVAQGRLFFFNEAAPTEIYTLPLHDAFPI